MTNGRRACLRSQPIAAALLAISGVLRTSRRPERGAQSLQMEDGLGEAAGRPEDGRADRRRGRPRRQERVGVRPLRRQRLRQIERRADHEVRSDRQDRDELRRAACSTSRTASASTAKATSTSPMSARKNGKGAVLVKFSPDGKVLMTLGKPGMPGDGQRHARRAFRRGDRAEWRHLRRRRPRRQHQRPHREVLQGRQVHQGLGQARQGAGRVRHAARHRASIRPGASSSPTASTAACRSSTPTASSCAEWKQFGRPSSVAIDKNDVLYVADSQSDEQRNPASSRASGSAAPRTAR